MKRPQCLSLVLGRPSPVWREDPHEFWQNKVVLVTGGSSGLGRVIAEAFAAAGAKVAIVGLEADAVEQAADEMQAAGRDVLGIHADITRQEDVDRLFAADAGPLRAARRAGEQRRPLDARQGARHHAGAVPRPDGVEPDRPGALHPGGRAALAPAARATWSTSARWRRNRPPAGSAPIRPPSSPWRPTRQQLRLELGPQGLHVLLVCPGPIQRKDARLYPLEGLGGRARERPENRGPACRCGPSRRRACPGDSAGVPAPPAGIGHPRQGPAPVRPFPALAEPGRLDRAAEDVDSER